MSSRTVLIHYHLFKNAGSSVDHILRANFGDRWLTAEFPLQNGDNSQLLGEWIASSPEAVAFSSHTAMGPLPDLPGIRIVPIVFLRDPVARILSAYQFERRQDQDTWGSRLAKSTDFEGYVRERLNRPKDRQCRNFQTWRLAAFRPGPEPEGERALAALEDVGPVGVVEQFGLSMQRIGQRIAEAYPTFFTLTTHRNRTTGRDNPEIGADLMHLLREANADDAALLDWARSLLAVSGR